MKNNSMRHYKISLKGIEGLQLRLKDIILALQLDVVNIMGLKAA